MFSRFSIVEIKFLAKIKVFKLGKLNKFSIFLILFEPNSNSYNLSLLTLMFSIFFNLLLNK